jgi:very-short-patch-repair endonuclease
MQGIERVIRSRGYFLRRRDLLALGYTDGDLQRALRDRRIFRVRQGWYSIPRAPEAGIRAVRVGGRLTGISALEALGLCVPRRDLLHVAVKPTASRLRRATDRHARLLADDAVRVLWTATGRGGTPWRVSVSEALLAVLSTETRDVAVACCSAALRHRKISASALAAVFALAPERARRWSTLPSALDDSHGETFVRLWLMDAGVPCEQQFSVAGVGRLDFRLSPNSFVEIDGAQHDPRWTGETPSSYERDHDRDTTMSIGGARVQRFTYRQLYSDWPRVLAAIERAIADDLALTALRARRPYRPVKRKRRRIPDEPRPHAP